jgi:hypothetical protein
MRMARSGMRGPGADGEDTVLLLQPVAEALSGQRAYRTHAAGHHGDHDQPTRQDRARHGASTLPHRSGRGITPRQLEVARYPVGSCLPSCAVATRPARGTVEELPYLPRVQTAQR